MVEFTILFNDFEGLDFFGNLKAYSNIFQGTVQKKNSSDYKSETYDAQTDPAFILENATMVCLHEFSHTFGLPDGPPKLSELNGAPDLARYYPGNLNITHQRFMPSISSYKVPIMSLHNLAKMGWVDVVDFTRKSFINERLYDLRLASDMVDEDGKKKRGQIFKFVKDFPDLSQQIFYFAFHSGLGADSELPSKGLEIQHVYIPSNGGEAAIVDVESAFGLFHNISSRVMPDADLPNLVEATGWGDKLPVEGAAGGSTVFNTHGFDNYDLWKVYDGSGGWDLRELLVEDSGGLWGDYSKFVGNIYDFFSIVDPPGPLGSWIAPEFSFLSNPHCYWYGSTDAEGIEHPSDEYRWHLQDVPNSMIVRIKEQDNDGLYPNMVVDFVSGPYEEVSIDSGTTYQVGDRVYCSYTPNFNWQDYLSGFDVFISPNSNGLPLIPVEDVTVDPEGNSFSFPVQEVHGTVPSGGLVIVKFKNNLTTLTGDYVAGRIVVNSGQPSVYEELLAPINGDQFFVGQPFRVEWSANFPSSDYLEIDVLFTQGNTVVWETTVNDFGNDWNKDEESNRYYCDISDIEEILGDSGSIQLVFYDQNSQSVESNVQSGVSFFPMLPEYEDVSQVAFDGETYTGSPEVIAPIHLGGNKAVVMALQPEVGQTAGTIFEYVTYPSGNKFEKVQNTDFEGEAFFAGASGISVADYNGDGADDFFVCNPGIGLDDDSVLFTNDGSGVFTGTTIEDVQYTNNTQCATWVDCNHDGYLDLYLGRGVKNMFEADRNSLIFFDPNSSSGEFYLAPPEWGLFDPDGDHATMAAVWSDWDQDGYWDVVVGDNLPTGNTQVFKQVGDSFALVTGNSPFTGYKPNSFNLQDFDLDGKLDLVVGMHNNISVFNDLGSFPNIVGRPIWFNEFHQVVSGDCDGNGVMDLLVSAGNGFSAGELVHGGFTLLKNLHGEGFFAHDFVDIGSQTGFPDHGNAYGATQLDFDCDGDLDILCGLEFGMTGGAFWENHSDPEKWVGIDLVSASGASPFGAVVTLKSGVEIIGMQTFGSGSGNSCQGPNDLVFAIDPQIQVCDLSVQWPNSETTNETITIFGEYLAIEESKFWEFQNLKFGVVLDQLETDWVFSWTTTAWTPSANVWIEFAPTGNCNIPAGVLIADVTPGVTLEMTYDRNSSEVNYLYRMVYEDAPCLPGCTGIEYQIHGGNAKIENKSSGLQTGRLPKLCPIISGN